jgi:hypothetical protein
MVFSAQLPEGWVPRLIPPSSLSNSSARVTSPPSPPSPARLTRCSWLYSNQSPLYHSLWGRQPHTRKVTLGVFLLPSYHIKPTYHMYMRRFLPLVLMQKKICKLYKEIFAFSRIVLRECGSLQKKCPQQNIRYLRNFPFLLSPSHWQDKKLFV